MRVGSGPHPPSPPLRSSTSTHQPAWLPPRLGDRRTMMDPDSDPAWAGADSMALLASVAALVAGDAWRVANVDVTVVTESPRLAPHRSAMQDRLSAVLDAPVSVKGKRAEGLGALGRQEGIACWAVALLERP